MEIKNRAELFQETDEEIIKSCIEKESMRKKLNLSSNDVIRLIEEKLDDEYIWECLYDYEKRCSLGISPYYVARLIEILNVPEYTKKCIENKDIRKEFGFDVIDIARLIKSVDDQEYTKSIIESEEKRKELRLDFYRIVDLLNTIKDTEYIKGVIEDDRKLKDYDIPTYVLVDLINKIKEPEYSKKFIEDEARREKYNLHSLYIYRLIEGINDKDYTKSFIDDKRKRENVGLAVEDVANLIKSLGTEYTKYCIEEKLEDLNLKSANIAELIKSTGELGYIKSIVKDQNKIKKLGLNKLDIFGLAVQTDDIECIQDFLEKIYDENCQNSAKQIKLPSNMTIGIEIESEGYSSSNIGLCSDVIEEEWKCESDGSLIDGIEVISPILTGNMEKASETIKKVCDILKKLRTRSNRGLWSTCAYRSRFFKLRRKLGEFNRDMGKYRKNIIYNKQ